MPRRLVLPALLVLALSYFMFNGLVDSMTFYPAAYPDGCWDLAERLGATDVELEAADGVGLHAWFVPAEKQPAVVSTVFLHGNAGNLTHREPHIQAVTGAGSDLLILDYRGYGKSSGSPSEEGVYLDAVAGYDWLRTRGAGPIICHGESLGTAVAAELATRRACAGLVLEAPFTSRRAMAGRVVPLLGPLVASGFDTAAKVGAIEAPVLILHGTADDVVPYSLGRQVFESASEPKEFWSLEAGHNDLLAAAASAYVPRLTSFYQAID